MNRLDDIGLSDRRAALQLPRNRFETGKGRPEG